MDIADVLRGIAVFGILLLHCIEHFDYYFFPEESSCRLLAFCDKAVWDGLFFTFSGKAYAIFSMLFGYTFWLQDERVRREGGDFRWRFVWRLVLLAGFGMVNSAFFPGDVLVLFAIVGMTLPMVARLPDGWVMAIAVVLLAQPEFIVGAVKAFVGAGDASGAGYVPWWQATMEGIASGDLWTTLKTNATDGKVYSLVWSRDYGRMTQSPGLMMIGMLVGRRGLFEGTERNIRFWAKAVLVALVCYFPLRGIAGMIPEYVGNEGAAKSLEMLFGAWHKLAFMVAIVGAIIVVFYRTRLRGALMRFTPIGRMSLTMYVAQSLIGSFVFYPWGLDLGTRLGWTASVGVGVVMLAILYTFAVLWLGRWRQGPLEYVWRKATWAWPGCRDAGGSEAKTGAGSGRKKL